MKKFKFIFSVLIALLAVSCSIDKDPLLAGLDGQDGVDGIDGKDGQDGQNAYLPSFNTIELENGTTVIIFIDSNGNNVYEVGVDTILSTFFVKNGSDGEDGSDGQNGTDGQDGANGSDGQDGEDGLSLSVSEVEEEGGTTYLFYYDINGNEVLDETDVIVLESFIEDGQDGADGSDGQDGSNGSDGQDGSDGADGNDGQDGLSPKVVMYPSEGGTSGYFYYDLNNNNIYDQEDILIDEFFIADGQDGADGSDGEDGNDGQDGSDGQDGQDGEDGRTPIIDSYSYGCGIKVLYGFDLNGDGELRFNQDEILGWDVVCDGEDGSDGQNGTDGQDGQNGSNGSDGQDGSDGNDGSDGISCWDLNGNGINDPNEDINEDGVWDALDCQGMDTVTICHKVTHGNNIPQEWVGQDKVTLTLSFSEYVQHVYEYHNGNSTQNDSFGACPTFDPVRLAVKDPYNEYGEGEAGQERYWDHGWKYRDCHYNYSTVVVETSEDYEYWTEDYQYANHTFELPNNKDADDYDCDSTPNL